MAGKVICFGEVLWDKLPGGAVPGGAPMNGAIRLQSLGYNASIISRVGTDSYGKDLLAFLESRKVDTSLIQHDEKNATGIVEVALNEKKQAIYTIAKPAAWDYIGLDERAQNAVENSDAFIFGSLASRNSTSKETLFKLLDFARFKVFDINLRAPYYDFNLLTALLKKTDMVKLNDKELLYLARESGSKWNSITDNILFLTEKFHIKKVCVTRGEDGAVLLIDNQFYFHNGFNVSVVDTVGTGDSFLAALIAKLLSNAIYDEAIAYACALGALVASKTGANPEIMHDEIDKLMKM